MRLGNSRSFGRHSPDRVQRLRGAVRPDGSKKRDGGIKIKSLRLLLLSTLIFTTSPIYLRPPCAVPDRIFLYHEWIYAKIHNWKDIVMRNGILLLFIGLSLTVLPGCDANNQVADVEKDMIFKKKPAEIYVISSPLKGQLLNDGKPLARTKIIRQLEWEGQKSEIVHEFMTNDDGMFDLPVHEEKLSGGGIGQFVAYTEIFVELDGQREGIWTSTKMHKGLNSEFNTPPQGFICDIASPKASVEINHGMCVTKCRWSNMPKENTDE